MTIKKIISGSIADGSITSVKLSADLAANIAAPGGLSYVYKTANYTAQNNEGILADTSAGSFTVTLPASPEEGYQVVVADPSGSWGANNITIARNGSNIGGVGEDLAGDINNASIEFIYDGNTWAVYSQVGGVGGYAITSVAGIEGNAVSNTHILNGLRTVDGAGSGLDADTLDGVQAAAFAQLSGATFTGNVETSDYFIGDGSQLTGITAVPTITNLSYPGTDLAVLPDGGETVVITGSGFQSGCQVYIGATIAPTVTFTNSTSVSFTTPALTAGNYLLYIINPNGTTGIAVPGLSVSGVPVWTTSAGALTNVTEDAYAGVTLNATSDSNITYSIYSGALPSGLSLDANTGVISGTVSSAVANLTSNTTYNFTIDAEDQELQNTLRTFSITYVPTFPTWYDPSAGALTAGEVGIEYTATLNAISNSNVTYTIPSGNITDGNVNISGNTLVGTAAAANTYYFTIRATDEEGHYTDREFSLNFAVGADTYFPFISTLIQADGIANNGDNSTITDLSDNALSKSKYGDINTTGVSPFAAPAGYWSGYFNGSNGYYSVTGGSALNLSGNFTVECWFNFPNMPAATNDIRVLVALGGDADGLILSFAPSTQKLYSYFVGSGFIWNSVSPVFNKNQWYHIAWVRSGSTHTLYVDGTSIGTFSSSSAITGSTSGVGLNFTGSSFGSWKGYISNLRVTSTAVYTSNFTPSTTPLTKISGTQFLTCGNNFFNDRSDNGLPISNYAATTVPKSPFTKLVSYDPATHGGALMYDGTGDALEMAGTAGTAYGENDFTEEAWVWYTNYNCCIFANGYTGGGHQIYINNDMSIEIYYQQGVFFTTPADSLQKYQWNHFVFTRSGNTIAALANGKRLYSTTISGSTGTSNPYGIGCRPGPNYLINGYVTGVRFVNGSSVYGVGTTYTVPTAPPSKITGTQLLLTMDNTSIYDKSGINGLRPVGDTKIKTDVYKYGTGSIYFDGTGDFLTMPYSQELDFGTGDFTVECWAKITFVQYTAIFTTTPVAIGTTHWLLGYSNTTNQMAFGIDSNGDAIIGADYSSYLNTWTHIAVARTGSTLKMFFNGTQVASISNSSNFVGDPNNYAVFGRRYTDNTSYPLNGYIDDFRITKGVARYTSSFTPPDSAFVSR